MLLNKKQRKFFTVIIAIATLGLLLTSVLPFLSLIK
jgi:hypothetical protein